MVDLPMVYPSDGSTVRGDHRAPNYAGVRPDRAGRARAPAGVGARALSPRVRRDTKPASSKRSTFSVTAVVGPEPRTSSHLDGSSDSSPVRTAHPRRAARRRSVARVASRDRTPCSRAASWRDTLRCSAKAPSSTLRSTRTFTPSWATVKASSTLSTTSTAFGSVANTSAIAPARLLPATEHSTSTSSQSISLSAGRTRLPGHGVALPARSLPGPGPARRAASSRTDCIPPMPDRRHGPVGGCPGRISETPCRSAPRCTFSR